MSDKVTIMIFDDSESAFYGQLRLSQIFDWKGSFKAYYDLRYGGLPPIEKAGLWSWRPVMDKDAYWGRSQGGWLATDLKLDNAICFYDKDSNGLVLSVKIVFKNYINNVGDFNCNGRGARILKTKGEDGQPMEDICFRSYAL